MEGTLDRLLPMQEAQSPSQELLVLTGPLPAPWAAQPTPPGPGKSWGRRNHDTRSSQDEESHSILIAHSLSNQQQDGSPDCFA